MLPFGVAIPATVPQGSEIPEEPMNYMYRGRTGTTLFVLYIIYVNCDMEDVIVNLF